MTIESEFRDIFEHLADWQLVRSSRGGCAIINRTDQGFLIIEDSSKHRAVVERMLALGVPVVELPLKK